MKRILNGFYNYTLVLATSILLFSLSSCEWDGSDDENFKHIDKPDEQIEVPIVFENDIVITKPVQIGEYQHFYFSYLTKREAKNTKFLLDGKEFNPDHSIDYQGHPQFSISMERIPMDGKIHELTVATLFPTGSPSLASNLGAEGYIVEFTVPIILIKHGPRSLHIKQEVDANNNLKITWEKTDFSVDRYEIYLTDNQLGFEDKLVATVASSEPYTFVQKDYAYGTPIYKIKTIAENAQEQLMNDDQYRIVHKSLSTHTKAVDNNTVRLTIDNPNPYPAKYVIEDVYADNKTYEMAVGQKSIDLPINNDNISKDKLYHIHILPASADFSDYEWFNYEILFYLIDVKKETK